MAHFTGSRPRLAQRLLVLEPQYRERVWGGPRLRAADPPIGEAWVACGDSLVQSGRLAGSRLADLAATHPVELLGDAVAARFGPRVPLLAKILDCADWLSVQVHPNDEQAERMVGPDEFGKTEAWFFLEAEPGAKILLSVKPGTTAESLAGAIRSGHVLEVAAEVSVRTGEAVLIPAGTLHALGPGLLLYEIQQASDTTYRVYDWDRPQSAGRKLHVEESAEVARPVGPEPLRLAAVAGTAGATDAIDSPYFDVDLVRAATTPLPCDTHGRSFHYVTVVEGTAEVEAGGEKATLGRFETAMVAGSAGPYSVRAAAGTATLLRTAVPS
jgi:mannose-6-phosphate isomerase